MTSYIGVPPFSQTVRTTTSLTASNNQTTFYPTGGYIVGYIDVSVNGVKLIEGSDYSAGDGISVVLSTGTSNNDVIEFTAYGAISFADSVKRSGDVFTSAMLVQDLIPTSNNTYSLGNTTNRFANIYLSGNTIILGDSSISANDTHMSFKMSNGEPMPVAANLNASLPSTGVVANTYGNTTAIPVITVDEQGRITNASTSSVSGVNGLSYESSNNTLTVSTSTTNFDASIQAGLDQSYTNAVSVANTLASDAYANAVSAANTLASDFAANAYANAVSAANTTSFNQASNAYANAVSAANTLASDFAANAYANVFLGGTFTGNVTANNVSLNGDLQVDGNLTVSGNSITLSARSLSVKDNMIYMNQGILATITNITGDGANVVFTADNNFANGWDVAVYGVDPASYNGNYADILEANATHFVVANTNTDTYVSGGFARGKTDANPDLGFAAGYNDGTYHHTGLFRDATDAIWKFFHQYEPEPDASVYIDTANNTFALANVQANYFIGTLSGDASSVGGNTASTLLAAADTAYSNAVAAAASTYVPLSGGNMSGDLYITKNFPKLVLDSSSSGDNRNEQGASISLGESGFGGTATLHLTYTGDGYGHIGMGSLTSSNSYPSLRAMSFYYQDRIVRFDDYTTAAGSHRAPIFYDSDNTAFYTDPASKSSLSVLNLGGNVTSGAPYNNATGECLLFGGYSSDGYVIGTNLENVGGNYTKLDFRWHTGIRIGAQPGYGGVRFYTNEDFGGVTLQINGSNNYMYKYHWMYTNTNGFYSDTNGAHWYPNTNSSYGAWYCRGSRNNWYGILIEGGNRPHVMFDASGNGGFYHQDGGRWSFYYHYTNNCIGIVGSTTNSSYGLYANKAVYLNNAYAAAYYYTSDIRLKGNVCTINNALEKILQLRGVNFDWIGGEQKGKYDAGLIAQEVEKVIPEAVTPMPTAELEDGKSISTTPIIGYLIEAIKELKKEIDELKGNK